MELNDAINSIASAATAKSSAKNNGVELLPSDVDMPTMIVKMN